MLVCQQLGLQAFGSGCCKVGAAGQASHAAASQGTCQCVRGRAQYIIGDFRGYTVNISGILLEMGGLVAEQSMQAASLCTCLHQLKHQMLGAKVMLRCKLSQLAR
jgi:hypothetical protein